MPPIDYQAAARDIFDDLNTVDEHGDIVECTCTWREVITYSDETEEQETEPKKKEEGDLVKINNSNSNGDMSDEEEDDDDETDDFCPVDDIVMEKSPSPPPRSAVKSIFDPEYDANENLIEEMVRSRTKMRAEVIEVKIEKDAVKSSRIESLMNNFVPDSMPPPTQNQMERVPIINYVCEEDPMCPARAHFRRDPVTQRDVEKIHNQFIPGVNGFFNGMLEDAEEHDFKKDVENIDYAKNRLWKRVVPRYNFRTLDKVPKTFDDDSPFSTPPMPPLDVEIKKEPGESFNGQFSSKEHRDIEFREWHQVMNIRSCNDEILTILPYVVID